MAVKNSVAALGIATFDSATLTGSFQTFTTLSQACFLIHINNTSDVAVIISWDGGTTSHEVVLAGKDLYLDFQANAQPNGFIAKMASGTKVSIKQVTAAGTGNIYLTGYYQAQAN